MKFILASIFSIGLMFAQPTVSPSSVNVTFDLATDTIVAVPDVTISSNAGPFAFNTVVPSNQQAVLVWPVQGFIPPGTNQVVKMSVVNNGLSVGSYNIPVNFVQNSPSVSVSVGINLTVIDSRTFTASTDPTIPHIASGGGWTTTVRLTNTSNWISLVTLKFYEPSGTNSPFHVNGNYVLEHSVVVPGNGSVDVVMSDPVGLKTGSLDIRTVYGSGVVAQATYSNSLFEGTIPSSIPNRDSFTIPYDNYGPLSTGLALVNYLNYPQEVEFSFYDNLGNLLHTDKVTLPAKGQTALTLDVAFPLTKGKTGSVKIKTARPALTGFGLKFNRDKGYFTTIPIF
jgi:hypothetical protein